MAAAILTELFSNSIRSMHISVPSSKDMSHSSYLVSNDSAKCIFNFFLSFKVVNLSVWFIFRFPMLVGEFRVNTISNERVSYENR